MSLCVHNTLYIYVLWSTFLCHFCSSNSVPFTHSLSPYCGKISKTKAQTQNSKVGGRTMTRMTEITLCRTYTYIMQPQIQTTLQNATNSVSWCLVVFTFHFVYPCPVCWLQNCEQLSLCVWLWGWIVGMNGEMSLVEVGKKVSCMQV